MKNQLSSLLDKQDIKSEKPKGEIKTERVQDYLPDRSSFTNHEGPLRAVVQTVHAVKGETHELTIFVCPEEKSNNDPSSVWWSISDLDQEERRIAFVAFTRTKGDLIVYVPEKYKENLRIKREEFFLKFECKSVEEFISKDH